VRFYKPRNMYTSTILTRKAEDNTMHKPTLTVDKTGNIDIEAWLQKLPSRYATDKNSLIRHAASLAQLTGKDTTAPSGISCLEQDLLIGNILSELNVDQEALSAGILYSCVRYADLELEDISEELSQAISKIIRGAERMDII